MKYMGSKSRIVKDILPLIQRYIDNNNTKLYIEPFCGGCNVIDKVVCDNKVATDKHEYLIKMYKNLDKIHTMPEFITKEHYSELRDCFNKKLDSHPKWYVGAVGFLASYNGRFFDGGYAGLVNTKAGTTRNYYDEAKRNLENQIADLKDIYFECKDYKDVLLLSKNAVIYCDPPYKDTKQYGINKSFDYDDFWEYVRVTSRNNIVLVSECQAPDDATCIWSQEVLRTIDNSKRVSSVERIFTYNI